MHVNVYPYMILGNINGSIQSLKEITCMSRAIKLQLNSLQLQINVPGTFSYTFYKPLSMIIPNFSILSTLIPGILELRAIKMSSFWVEIAHIICGITYWGIKKKTEFYVFPFLRDITYVT